MAATARLDVRAMALAAGILMGVGMFILGLVAWLGGGPYAVVMVSVIGNVYWGYEPSFIGSCLGLVWGFADAFVCGAILAWLYNKLAA